MTAADYVAMQETLAQSPAARSHLEQSCREDTRGRTEEERAAIGVILDVDRDQVDQVFCERLVAAIARGDLSYEDFTGMQQDSQDFELMRRVLRAFRRAPGQYAI
jgi:hypothetical protein